jgi:hypothetical protein
MDLLSVNINYVVNGWTIDIAYMDNDEIQCMKFVAQTWPEVMELLKEHIDPEVAVEQTSATVYDMDAARAVRNLELEDAGDMILEMNDKLNGIDYDE